MPEIQELIAHPRVIEVLDQASFTENAITTLEKRYLLRDEIGNFRETVPELFVRVAWNISEAELRNGESPEHRFEVFLKFLEIMIRREFMPNSPTLFNAGTPSQMLSACFPAGTSITTMDGPMAIEDVRLGDRVLTHEGRYRRVTETMNRYGQLWRVKVDKLPEMLVTEEHPILTQRGWVAVKDLRPKSDFVAIGRVTERESTPSVIQVAGLTVDGYVYQPRVGVASQAGSVVSQQVKPVKAAVQIDEDISWLLGMYISQGSISAGYDLRFALSTDKPEQATKLSSILEERFGLAVSVVHTEREDTGYRWTTVRIHSKLFVNWIQEHFGSGFNQKLLPSWFMKQPIRVLSAFLRGVADGDGTPVNRYQTRITLSNEPLVRQLFDVAVTLGYSPSLRKEYLPPHATAQPWAMTYGPIYHSAMVRDGYYRVKAIAPTGEVAAVYNFEVEEDHSYVANQVVVHNCFVMPIDDSIEDIYTTLKHTAHVHRAGGGTGFSFSNLRESGAFVSTTSGTASGPIDFLRLYDASTNAVKQGGKRRGANMAILRVDHPDILDFITCKQDTSQITNFNISVAITREFMQALQNGCSYPIRDPRDRNKIRYYLDARAVWQLIVHSAWTTGEPGLFFIDRANDTNPMPHVSEIEATNPCVTGDTRIATQYGLLSAKELHKRHLPILATVDASVTGEGGIEVQPATPVEQTAELADIFQVKTKQGYQLRLTANHKVPTKRGVVPAGELRKGDKLFLQSGEGQWGEEGDFRLGFLIGAFQADGHFDNERGAILDLHGHKIEAADQILEWANDLVRGTALGYRPEYELTAVPAKGGTRSTITSIRLARLFAELGFGRTTKHQVPEAVWRGNREMVRGYLQALFSFDGSVQGSRQTGVTIRLAQSDLKLLSDVQILLANFGIMSRLRKARDEGYRMLPGGRGGNKAYFTKTQYELMLTGHYRDDFYDEIGLAFSKHRNRFDELTKDFTMVRNRKEMLADVVMVEPDGQEPVYNLTVNKRHSFIANGITVRNCGEADLIAYDSCNLGSINLAAFIKEDGYFDFVRYRDVIHIATHFLDNVIDMNKFPIPEIDDMSRKSRRIGLGVMGLGDTLFALKIPYDSQEGFQFCKSIIGMLRTQANTISEERAARYGYFPHYLTARPEDKASGRVPARRNSYVSLIAPTGTISIIAGCSGGIEPLFSLAFERNVMGGTRMREVNPYFVNALTEAGFTRADIDGLVERLIRGESLQTLAEVPAEIRRVFVTAQDIAPDDHVRMQAAAQRHTESAVSKTINLPYEATTEDVEKAYFLAWDLGCKGITVYRDGSRGEQPMAFIKDEQPAEPKGMPCPECEQPMTPSESCWICFSCDLSLCG